MSDYNASRKKNKGNSTLDAYFQKKRRTQEDNTSSPIATQNQNENESSPSAPNTTAPTRERVTQFDINSLSYDPGLRKRISDYHPDDQDAVRRAYIQRTVVQPRDHDFQQRFVGGGMRRFNPDWYDAYKTWLECSIAKEAAFCFVCYLFRDDIGAMDGDGHDTFVSKGFKGWNRPHAFSKHVGAINSVHNRCMEKYNALIDPQTSIQNVLSPVTPQARKDYQTRLVASLDCLRYLLLQGMAIRGHDESENSFNQGNFRELLKWYAKRKKKVAKVVLKNAPEIIK
ncbi:uncharacterized protein [Spinacia oleracea]|uniref:TTF-type domain-containing protein n=1 Tax=Spinacia oleracea TaxID=3562 RepID=A0ABM3R1Z5_SPIOL|nr:uncharacterized protein LOC130464201 [Spinacia oleracea]